MRNLLKSKFTYAAMRTIGALLIVSYLVNVGDWGLSLPWVLAFPAIAASVTWIVVSLQVDRRFPRLDRCLPLNRTNSPVAQAHREDEHLRARMGDSHQANVPRVELVSAQAAEPRAAIYLVHGTWAPEAPWTDERSVLTQTLLKAGIPGLHIYRLIWSGKNRAYHREKAAECLANALKSDPTMPTVLIGHSHGGSVINSALMRSVPEKRVHGVVCFNTPFFTSLRRNLEARLAATFWFWTFGGMGAIPFLAKVTEASLFLLAGAVWAVGILTMVSLYQSKALSTRQKTLVPKRKPCHVRYLCLTTADDEAFGALSTIEAVCSIEPYAYVNQRACIACAVGMTTGGRYASMAIVFRGTTTTSTS